MAMKIAVIKASAPSVGETLVELNARTVSLSSVGNVKTKKAENKEEILTSSNQRKTNRLHFRVTLL